MRNKELDSLKQMINSIDEDVVKMGVSMIFTAPWYDTYKKESCLKHNLNGRYSTYGDICKYLEYAQKTGYKNIDLFGNSDVVQIKRAANLLLDFVINH